MTLARLLVRLNERWTERFIGHLLAETFRARMHGSSLEDVHEARHLMAALAAGNSDPCEGGRSCHLDKATMRALQDANWPEPSAEWSEYAAESVTP